NAIEAAPVSGSPIELLVMTGDAIDNAQANEFATYTALFEGGMVNPASGGIEIESVQSPGWPDGSFWKPDGGGFGPDLFRVAHGFTPTNRRDRTAYYVHDTSAVRLIVLDTSCCAGGADGCIERDQLAWLEEKLMEVHAVYTDSAGNTVHTSNANRLVVIASHHP